MKNDYFDVWNFQSIVFYPFSNHEDAWPNNEITKNRRESFIT